MRNKRDPLQRENGFTNKLERSHQLAVNETLKMKLMHTNVSPSYLLHYRVQTACIVSD